VTLASDAVMKWLVYLSKIKTLRSAHIMHFSSCFSLMCITVLEGQPFHVNSLEAMSYISLTSVTCDQLRILSQTKIDCVRLGFQWKSYQYACFKNHTI